MDMIGPRDVTTFQRVYRHKLRPEVTDTADLMDSIWATSSLPVGPPRTGRRLMPLTWVRR
jgi:hypothetical protein